MFFLTSLLLCTAQNTVDRLSAREYEWAVTPPEPERRRATYTPGTLDEVRTLTNSERQDMLDRHNYWRNRAALGELAGTNLNAPAEVATQMPRMYWDTELEEASAAWAAECYWAHSSYQDNYNNPLSYSYGENLWISQNENFERFTDAIDDWSEEYVDYDPMTRACVEGRMCGHYTQIVWESTVRVGCAVSTCHATENVWGNTESTTYLVCQYSPPGNYIGQSMYTFGQVAGSECSVGVYGSSTGTIGGDYPGLCNNANTICSEAEDRCDGLESTCAPGTGTLNGFVTDYVCESTGCSQNQYNGEDFAVWSNWLFVRNTRNSITLYGSLSGCMEDCYSETYSNECVACSTDRSGPYNSYYFMIHDTSSEFKVASPDGNWAQVTCGEGPTAAPPTTTPPTTTAAPTTTQATTTTAAPPTTRAATTTPTTTAAPTTTKATTTTAAPTTTTTTTTTATTETMSTTETTSTTTTDPPLTVTMIAEDKMCKGGKVNLSGRGPVFDSPAVCAVEAQSEPRCVGTFFWWKPNKCQCFKRATCTQRNGRNNFDLYQYTA